MKTLGFLCNKKQKKSIESIWDEIEKVLDTTNENQISMTNQLAQQWVDEAQMVRQAILLAGTHSCRDLQVHHPISRSAATITT